MGRGYTANGAPDRSGGTDLVSDGAHILDPGCACNANQTINPDMVQEVKVSTSTYGADSQTGPVVLSAVSKSGSSEYHGGVYMHFRDASMNSWDYHLKQAREQQLQGGGTSTITKPNDRYWYPGGQFGGPVPFTNKKLIFFAGFEYYNQRFPEQTSNGLLQANLPTLSERAGLFDPTLPDNAAVCAAVAPSIISDGRRCTTFNSISTASGTVTGITNEDISAYIGPGAKALLKLIPLPNHTPTSAQDYNWIKTVMNSNNGYIFHTRVDYNFNDSTKLYVSFNQQHELYGSPVQRWWLPGNAIDWPGGASSSDISRTISGNLVKVFNSTTTNEFIVGLSYLGGPYALGNEKAVDRTALGYPYRYPYTSTATTMLMPSIQNGWYTNDWGVPQMLDTGRVDYTIRKMQPSISDNFTKIFGTHTVKFGMSWLRSGNREANVDQGSGANGTVTYGPIWDANGSSMSPILNMMLDHPSGFSYAPVTVADMKGSSWGFYGQDEWKVTKRFGINYGLRITHDTPWVDATGKFGVAVWTPNLYGADRRAGITNLPGMRWHARDNSIPLGGYSLDSAYYAPRFGLSFDVFGTGKTILRGGIGSYFYRDGLQGSAGTSVSMGATTCSLGSAFLSQIDQGLGCNSNTDPVSVTANDPNDHAEPHTTTYNFTVSQQMPGASLLEVTYSGSQSSELLYPSGLQDVNAMQIGAFSKPDPNPDSANYGQYLAVSVINSSDSMKQDFKPYPRYKKLQIVRHGAWSNYNALQVSWSKQKGSFNYNLNYTWSKTLGIGATPDPININNDYGLVSQDRTHVFNASYSYEVGNRFKNKLGSLILNGWLISGITGIQSGPPLQAWSPNLNLGGNNTLPSNNTVNEMYYLGVTGDTKYSLMPALTCDPRKGRASGQYINPSCITLPNAPVFDASGVLTQVGGQGQYQWPYLRGPGYFSSDLSVGRTIKITERQNVQFKINANNFLNHPLKSFDQNNNQNINLNFNSGVLATQGAGWRYGVTNEKFGRRVLELTMKYNF